MGNKTNCAYELDGACYYPNNLENPRVCTHCEGMPNISIKQAQDNGDRYVIFNCIGRIVFSSRFPLKRPNPGDKQISIAEYYNILN